MAEPISLRDVGKIYPDGTEAVANVDLEIEPGELLVLVGPSGCGKSTLLRMIAGLETITDGEIEIAGSVVNDLRPKNRDVAMVFQNYALYPHMTVAENIGFGLQIRGVRKKERARQVEEAAALLELTEQLDRRPGNLSGGQRQRVAIGRAIVRRPAVFLMDEPLSNLDAKLRTQMRSELSILHERLQTTTVYVTHDQVEAMTLGSRVAVMRPLGGSESNLQQVGTPREIYERPANLFVASFVGSPRMNLLADAAYDGRAVIMSGLRFDAPIDASPQLQTAGDGNGLIVGLRPDDLRLVPDGEGTISGTTVVVEQLGNEALVHIDATEVRIFNDRSLGDREPEETSADRLIARVAPNDAPKVGETVHLRPDLSAAHFFDPASGEVLR